ncbi:MAG: 3-deoxy-D-manno-octulosonic acid transferase [Acidobacteriia bacterium]|nr:3-deoxy-D-manno-octulosonic acid transferase [Terriglobia bacterium]
MYTLYSLLLAVVAALSLPWWALQMLRLGKYRAGFAERIGRVPSRIAQQARQPRGPIWIHAVSVGEVLAVGPLVSQLRQASPDRQVFVSTTTATGQRLARQRFGDDHVFFMPLDFGFSLRPYFRALGPSLLVLAETEFWPNLLHLARRRAIPVAIVNARISDRSFPRYRRFRWFFSRVLANVDLFLTQTADDARRLKEIGAPAERVQVSGNLKFDIPPSAEVPLIKDLRRAISQDAPAHDSPVIVCGSTTEGEEEILLAAFRTVLGQFPGCVLVLAPRHPERFDKVAQLVSASAISGIKMVRRSTWTPGVPLRGCVFLLDSLGELASVYAIASVAFVGGSLLPGVGGHNILEPAQHGVAVVTGPNTENFREIVRIFLNGSEKPGGTPGSIQAPALRIVTPDNIAGEFLRLLQHRDECAQLGQRAKELFQQNTGATAKAFQALQPLLGRKEKGAQ